MLYWQIRQRTLNCISIHGGLPQGTTLWCHLCAWSLPALLTGTSCAWCRGEVLHTWIICLKLHRCLKVFCIRTSPSGTQWHMMSSERASLGKSSSKPCHGVVPTPFIRGCPFAYSDLISLWSCCNSDFWNFLVLHKCFWGWHHFTGVGCAKTRHPLMPSPRSQGFWLYWNFSSLSLVSDKKQHLWGEIQPCAFGRSVSGGVCFSPPTYPEWLLHTDIGTRLGEIKFTQMVLDRAQRMELHPGTDRSRSDWCRYKSLLRCCHVRLSFDGTSPSWSSTATEGAAYSRLWPVLGKRSLALMQCSRCVSDCCLWVPLLQMKGHNNRSVFSAENAPIPTNCSISWQGTVFWNFSRKKENKIYLRSVEKKHFKYISLNFTLKGKCNILNRKYISVIMMNVSL